MVVAFDADILILVLQPSIDPPEDPGTGRPVEHVAERLAQLVKDLMEREARVIVPAPALAEVLVVPGTNGAELLKVIEKQAVFQIEPFRAADAVEAAASTRAALDRGDKKSGADAPWQCIKTDRQIVAVAKRCGAEKLYSNDAGMRKVAGDLPVVSVWELPVPTEELKLPFNGRARRPPISAAPSALPRARRAASARRRRRRRPRASRESSR